MRVTLRKWKPEDAPDLTAAINNKKVLDNLRDGIPYPYTEKDAFEFITAMLSAENGSQYTFAITYDSKVIGSIGVFRKKNVHRLTAELGYYIAEPYWGKGIMTEAVRQLCDYIFENTDIIRGFAEPYARNAASCRVLEKAGFQFEGVLRKNALKNGQSLDMKMYAILKPPVIRLLEKEDIIPMIAMVWEVFEEFIAPDYEQDGIDEFKRFVAPEHIADKMASGEFKLWGAFDNETPVGVVALGPPLRIALLSVAKRYQKQGIARKLFNTALSDKTRTDGHDKITVNASPYAANIYRRLGFEPTNTEQTMNGLRFTPMEYKFHHKEPDKEQLSRIYPVILSEYNPAWPEWYAEEKINLERLIGEENIARINHYGSTSVPGLLAKPTIDILLEINTDTDIEKLKATLPFPEYIRMSDSDKADVPPLHLMFVKGYLSGGFAEKVYHIHVRYSDDWNELHFRDYLISHPETAAEYATLKQALFNDYEHNRDGYTAAKGNFIQAITSKAKKSNGEHYE